MDSVSKDNGRYVIAIGVDDPGDKSRLRPLKEVRNDLARVRKLFVAALGYHDVSLVADGASDNLNLDAEQIRRGLIAWRESVRRDVVESVVIYFSGHGLVRGSELHLCTRGFVDSMMASGLSVRDLGACLEYVAPKVWIILDVCYAGVGANALVHEAIRTMGSDNHALWFLASSGGRSPSHDGVFSEALAEAAHAQPTSYEGLMHRLRDDLERGPAKQAVQSFAAGHGDFDLLTSAHPMTPKLLRFRRRVRFLRRYAGVIAVVVALIALVSQIYVSGIPLREVPQMLARGNQLIFKSITDTLREALGVTARAEPNLAQASTPAAPMPMSDVVLEVEPQQTPTSNPATRPSVSNAPIDVPSNPAGIRARVLAEADGRSVVVNQDNPLRGGDRFGIYVTLPSAAYVGVIHIDRVGRASLLYPRHGDGHVNARALTRLPAANEGHFLVEPEPAVERFVVFSSTSPANTYSLDRVLEDVRASLTWPWQRLAPLVGVSNPPIRIRGTFSNPRDSSAIATGAVLLEVPHIRVTAL